MTIGAKREYLKEIRDRYRKSRKKEKSRILDEFCAVCGYCRKYAITILNRDDVYCKGRPGPKQKYSEILTRHLLALWKDMNQMCSKKMVAALPLWLKFKPELSEYTNEMLKEMSSSTIDRRLKPFKKDNRKGLSTTCPSTWVKNKIPIELLHEKVKEPGYVEADSVAHCGNAIEGSYAHSLTLTDLFSEWTENRAVWTKDAKNVQEAIEDIEKNLPFAMLGFASDNGTEFLNNALVDYFKERKYPVKFVRRRPYKKNDAAHVEQKNWTHVRQLYGYDRFDDEQLVRLMNEIYSKYWNPLQNFFVPVMKLKEKIRVGGRVKKIYDKPKTPYQRLLDDKGLLPSVKESLSVQYSWYNPFKLKKDLDEKLKVFFRLVEINKRAKCGGDE